MTLESGERSKAVNARKRWPLESDGHSHALKACFWTKVVTVMAFLTAFFVASGAQRNNRVCAVISASFTKTGICTHVLALCLPRVSYSVPCEAFERARFGALAHAKGVWPT